MPGSRRITSVAAGALVACGMTLSAAGAATADTPDRPGVVPAHAVLIPYCEEATFPFFGPVIICHTWFGDLTFSRPW